MDQSIPKNPEDRIPCLRVAKGLHYQHFSSYVGVVGYSFSLFKLFYALLITLCKVSSVVMIMVFRFSAAAPI